MIPDFINHRLDKIKEICKNYRVNAAYVFGSVLTDKFSDKSDIDLLVDFKRDSFHGAFDQFMNFKRIWKIYFKACRFDFQEYYA